MKILIAEDEDDIRRLLALNMKKEGYEVIECSLLSQVRQAKAAIVYPPKGLHTLLLGESGWQ